MLLDGLVRLTWLGLDCFLGLTTWAGHLAGPLLWLLLVRRGLARLFSGRLVAGLSTRLVLFLGPPAVAGRIAARLRVAAVTAACGHPSVLVPAGQRLLVSFLNVMPLLAVNVTLLARLARLGAN